MPCGHQCPFKVILKHSEGWVMNGPTSWQDEGVFVPSVLFQMSKQPFWGRWIWQYYKKIDYNITEVNVILFTEFELPWVFNLDCFPLKFPSWEYEWALQGLFCHRKNHHLFRTNPRIWLVQRTAGQLADPLRFPSLPSKWKGLSDKLEQQRIHQYTTTAASCTHWSGWELTFE